MINRILHIVFIAICAAIIWLLWASYDACVGSGGIYVRTMTGYECVKSIKP